MATLKLLILFLLISPCVLAQRDSASLFEKSKGKWEYPIVNCLKVEKYELYRSCMNPGNFSLTTNFISDKSVNAKAIFEGHVATVAKVEDMYVVITNYANYFITYVGLIDTELKKGDFILRGQTLGKIQKDYDDKFRLYIYLDKGEEQLDPFNWFIHNSCP